MRLHTSSRIHLSDFDVALSLRLDEDGAFDLPTHLLHLIKLPYQLTAAVSNSLSTSAAMGTWAI